MTLSQSLLVRSLCFYLSSTLLIVTRAQRTCITTFLADTPPAWGIGATLQSYESCNDGTLTVSAYVENLCYNKVVSLSLITGSADQTNLSFGYSDFVSGTNQAWEIWTASGKVTPSVSTQLLTLDYRAVDINSEYRQILDQTIPYGMPTGTSDDITSWLEVSDGSQSVAAASLLFDNIDIAGAANGTVIAAQSYTNPDYAFNWVRDASLVMDVVQQLFGASTNASAKAGYAQTLFAYAAARAAQQNDPLAATGLGEPKFNLNNSVFTGPWGRPQNDGPATSSITLMDFADAYISAGGSIDMVKELIYGSGEVDDTAPVLRDLLFVNSNWSSLSFDIWEEEDSVHFYDRMVSNKALIKGAAFATLLNDTANSEILSAGASAVSATLPQFYNTTTGQINYEIGPVLRGKTSYKDVATILGIIHGYADSGIFSYANNQVLATIYEVATSFLPIYEIANTTADSSGNLLGLAVGRYPEDTYNGTATANTAGGNPWFLATLAVAEILYDAVAELEAAGSLTVDSTSAKFWLYFAPEANLTFAHGQIILDRGTSSLTNATFASTDPEFMLATQALLGWADAEMRRARYHIGTSQHIAEEYDRTTGLQVGAADLSWSYASLLTAGIARAKVLKDETWLETLANIGF